MSVSRLDRDTQNTRELWKFLKCHNPFETEAVLMNIVNCVAPWYQAVNVENAQDQVLVRKSGIHVKGLENPLSCLSI